MTEISFHPASADEFRQCCINVFETWPSSDTLEAHLEWRLASPQHNYAQWYVGTIEGRVVVSLGAYPIRFQLDGRATRGLMIGAVHTVSDARGNGYAPRLLKYAEEHQRSGGAQISVLFSDIAPTYYTRLGYTACPSYGFAANIAELPTPVREPSLQTRLGHWPNDILQAAELYETAKTSSMFAVERPAEYWQHLSQRYPDARLVWILDPRNSNGNDPTHHEIGYCIYRHVSDCIELLDVVVSPLDAVSLDTILLTSIRAITKSNPSDSYAGESNSVRGWLPTLDCASCVRPEERPTEITMFKPLDQDLELSSRAVHDARSIQLMDHV